LERTITARVRIVEEERDRLEAQLREQELSHERQVRNIDDRHENQTATLQNRQAELQEELFRLRTDLSDEMLARQALSTQLEEQARDTDDRQREYEDQADLLSAVQAELAQEKHRATDLGVRLQEALLDVDGLRNAETTLIGQLQTLQDERSKSMQSLSDAQCQADSLESQLAGIQAELEATTGQLLEARSERDAALKSQSAEAERMMRDHIAEADGDRAVLEHQNLTLTKQLEDIRVEMAEKLTSARNSSLRQADGLKAELHFTKAQLRDAQRRETVLADELAMSKDTAQAMSQVTAHQSDVSRDAVALSSKYFDTCERLLTAINASSTISGTESKLLTKSRSPPRPESTSEGAMKESAMIRSLSQAQSFDLTVFSEAVQKTITMVKKLSRVTKGYKDLARHKISIANFAKGDLVSLPSDDLSNSHAGTVLTD
jgi:chromosome segregation ATPase